MKPIKIKTLLSALVLLALLALATNYLINNIHEFKQLSLTNIYLILPITIIFLINYFLIGLITMLLLKSLKLKLSLKESFALSIITGFYNLITPFRGGMAARAVYLKKRYDFAYVNFLATLSAVYVLVFLIASFLGIISTIIIYFQTGIFSWVLFLIFDAVFLLMLSISVASPKLKEREGKWINRFIKVINGWHLIKENKKIITITALITLIQIILSTIMLYLQFAVFGIEISFASALFLSSIGNLSIVIAVTPGNLGISEAITVFSALTIGITATESLSATLLGRAVSLVVLFILGPIFSYILLRKKSVDKA